MPKILTISASLLKFPFVLSCLILYCPSVWSFGERALKPYSPEIKKVALVVGNSNYGIIESLDNPINDALAMRNSLASIGFDVHVRLDGTREEIVRDLDRFGDRISSKNTIGLFFYAGHGVQIKGQNFLVPVDATLEAESLPNREFVPLSILLRQLGKADNYANIVILDACRNNPYTQAGKISKGLAEMNYSTGSDLLVAYATGPGEVAFDGDGSNSDFTRSLQLRIKEPESKIEDVFKQVVNDVKLSTKNKQQPWITFSLTKDLCLVSCPIENESGTISISTSSSGSLSEDETRFRFFVDYARSELVLKKESPTERDRYGRRETYKESYRGTGGGIFIQYFLNSDFSIIYKDMSTDLEPVSFTSYTGGTRELKGEGTIDFRSFTMAYNWGGVRDSWIGEWWIWYLGLGYGYTSVNLEAWTGQNYTNSSVTHLSGQGILGFDYRTESDWVIGFSIVSSSDGSPSGNRVQQLEEQGYSVSVSSSLTALSLGYQFY